MDAARLDADSLLSADHHHPAPIQVQQPMLGMNIEELWCCPDQAHSLGAEALDEVRAGFVDVRPGRGAEIPAGR